MDALTKGTLRTFQLAHASGQSKQAVQNTGQSYRCAVSLAAPSTSFISTVRGCQKAFGNTKAECIALLD